LPRPYACADEHRDDNLHIKLVNDRVRGACGMALMLTLICSGVLDGQTPQAGGVLRAALTAEPSTVRASLDMCLLLYVAADGIEQLHSKRDGFRDVFSEPAAQRQLQRDDDAV
jgi:hypothetical protein